MSLSFSVLSFSDLSLSLTSPAPFTKSIASVYRVYLTLEEKQNLTRSKLQIGEYEVLLFTCENLLLNFWLNKTLSKIQYNFVRLTESFNWFRTLGGTVLFQSKERFSRLIAAWHAHCPRNFINCVKQFAETSLNCVNIPRIYLRIMLA